MQWNKSIKEKELYYLIINIFYPKACKLWRHLNKGESCPGTTLQISSASCKYSASLAISPAWRHAVPNLGNTDYHNNNKNIRKSECFKGSFIIFLWRLRVSRNTKHVNFEFFRPHPSIYTQSVLHVKFQVPCYPLLSELGMAYFSLKMHRIWKIF